LVFSISILLLAVMPRFFIRKLLFAVSQKELSDSSFFTD